MSVIKIEQMLEDLDLDLADPFGNYSGVNFVAVPIPQPTPPPLNSDLLIKDI
jgi:hypothetical protein